MLDNSKDLRDFGFTEDPAPTPNGDSKPRATTKPSGPGKAAGQGREPRSPSRAKQIRQLAEERYRFGVSTTGETFAVLKPKEPDEEAENPTPNVAKFILDDEFIDALADEFDQRFDDVPGEQDLNGAIRVLRNRARRATPQPVAMRMARHDGRYILDLADATGRCVVADADGWTVERRSPVTFQRTEMMVPMPVPTPGSDGGALHEWLQLSLNVETKFIPLLAAWIVHAYMPDDEHSIMFLSGEQETGKTTATTCLCSLIDPCPGLTAQLPDPENKEKWMLMSSRKWLLPFGNMSFMPKWFSDSLCRSTDGTIDYKRAHHKNKAQVPFHGKNVVILNTISMDGMQPDLIRRLTEIRLRPISDAERRSKEDLYAEWFGNLPHILASVMDALVRVTATLPSVPEPQKKHGIESFRRVIAAYDLAYGTSAEAAFWGTVASSNADAVESSPLASLLLDFAKTYAAKGPWEGTPTKLYNHWRREDGTFPKDFPKSVGQFGNAIRRVLPALRKVGAHINPDHHIQEGGHRRAYMIEYCEREQAASNPTPSKVLTPDALAAEAQQHGDDTPF